MKQNTAIQDLIEWFNSKTQLFIPTKSQIIEKATELLKKEEEQIVKAANSNRWEMDKHKGQEYFNQTYNSNNQ